LNPEKGAGTSPTSYIGRLDHVIGGFAVWKYAHTQDQRPKIDWKQLKATLLYFQKYTEDSNLDNWAVEKARTKSLVKYCSYVP